jgi:hypothetical protein
MVMSSWYRFRLGGLQTQREYALNIEACDRWPHTWYGKIRACTGHPQVVVRVGVWLASSVCASRYWNCLVSLA